MVQPDFEYKHYDPEEGFEPQFQVLKDYYKEYQKLSQPEIDQINQKQGGKFSQIKK